MNQDEQSLDGTELTDLHPPTATLWGIVLACFGLAVLMFAWWPL
jgi:hypothetical protein